MCKCDCGNYVTVATKNLKDGKTKSCGCIKKEKPYGNLNDLTGKKFGRLTVIEVTDKETIGVRSIGSVNVSVEILWKYPIHN